MFDKRNLIFMNSICDKDRILLTISDAITSDRPGIFIIQKTNSLPHKLTSADLSKIRSSFPRHTTIYTRKPEFKYGRMTDLGRWQDVTINDLLINSEESKFIHKITHTRNPDMSAHSLESIMKLEDAWHKNDFAMILAIHNSDIGDEYIFQGLIFAAVEAGVLKPIPRQVDMHSDPKKRNFIFLPRDLINWAISKKLNIGSLADKNKDQNDELVKVIYPSTAERNQRYQLEANRIYAEAKIKPNKKLLAQAIYDYLKESDIKFITNNDGTLLEVGTISRNIKVPINSTATNVT